MLGRTDLANVNSGVLDWIGVCSYLMFHLFAIKPVGFQGLFSLFKDKILFRHRPLCQVTFLYHRRQLYTNLLRGINIYLRTMAAIALGNFRQFWNFDVELNGPAMAVTTILLQLLLL